MNKYLNTRTISEYNVLSNKLDITQNEMIELNKYLLYYNFKLPFVKKYFDLHTYLSYTCFVSPFYCQSMIVLGFIINTFSLLLF